MSNTIAQVVLADPPALSATATGAETQAQSYTLAAPSLASDPLTLSAPDGTTFSWKPTELVYRDAAGQMDYIVGSSPVSLLTRGTEARYSRTFPTADDVFKAQANGVKHWTILHEPPRSPASYLGTGIKFGVSGLITGAPLPPGVHDAIGTDELNLPQPKITDLAGKEILGQYEVVDTTNGQQLFVWFDAAFLNTAVYPIMIDPTVVVAAAYDTSGNGGRKLVRIANGTLVTVAMESAALKYHVYKSTDNGTTWTEMPISILTNTRSSFACAIAADGNYVHIVYNFYWSSADQRIQYAKIDVIGNAIVSGSTKDIDTTQYAVNNVSLCIDGTGALHAAWGSLNATYSNSNNIRYSKSTDGGTTWSAPTQITTQNTSGLNVKNPCIVVRSNNYPTIIYNEDGGTRYIKSRTWNGTGWNAEVIVYNSASLLHEQPCAAADGNDVIHAVWHGYDNVSVAYWIRYSKSTDGGATWSAITNLTSGITYDQLSPSITIDGSNKIRVFWHGKGDGGSTTYFNIRRIESADGGATWVNKIILTSNTTADALAVQTLWSKFNMNSTDAVRWVYKDNQAVAVEYDTIVLNTAPNAPTGLTRANLDATQAAIFTWMFSDPDPGNTQSAYQILIKRVSDGVTVVDTGKVASTTASHTLAASTLTNNVQYQWQVRTWDNSDAVGPYSSLATFTTSAKPSATITVPAVDGATVSTSSLTAEWSFSDPESEGQSAYQVKLTDNADVVLWDSGKVTDANARSRTIGYTLVNSTAYKVKLTVWDAKDIASTEVVRTFTVSFTPPAIPTLTATAQTGYIAIAITNPAPQGLEPTVTSNDLYRRKQGETTWTRIATGIANSGSYNDYAVASGQVYEYMARAIGDNGTTRDSTTASQSITLTGVWLHDVSDPVNTIHQFQFDGGGRNTDWQAEASFMQFAGRSRPVVEFGESEEGKFSVQLQLFSSSQDYSKLDALVKRKGTVCWRDGRGRKAFGVITALPVQDETFGYTTTVSLTEISYSEAV